jgi:hypothetical protein
MSGLMKPEEWDLGEPPQRAPRHPEGCVFCPAELLGLERDANGDPLCQTCPHLRAARRKPQPGQRPGFGPC